MSDNKKKDIVFNTGTGGFITIKNRDEYVIYEFSQKADADLFLEGNDNAEKRNTIVKYNSVWTNGQWVNTKTLTYKVLVRK